MISLISQLPRRDLSHQLTISVVPEDEKLATIPSDSTNPVNQHRKKDAANLMWTIKAKVRENIRVLDFPWKIWFSLCTRIFRCARFSEHLLHSDLDGTDLRNVTQGSNERCC